MTPGHVDIIWSSITLKIRGKSVTLMLDQIITLYLDPPMWSGGPWTLRATAPPDLDYPVYEGTFAEIEEAKRGILIARSQR